MENAREQSERNFGLTASFAGCELPPYDTLSVAETAGIRRIGIPGRWLDDDAFEETKRLLASFEVAEVADLAQSAISGNIIGQSPTIIDSFVEKMAVAIERAADIGAASVSLNLGEPVINGETGGLKERAAILKRLCPFLMGNDVKLKLPVRMPRVGAGCSWDEWSSLVLESMCPNVGLELRIHPHEPGGAEPAEGMERHTLLVIHSACFVFEPGSGNTLTPKSIKGWFDFFDASLFMGELFARPRVATPVALGSALSALSDRFDL